MTRATAGFAMEHRQGRKLELLALYVNICAFGCCWGEGGGGIYLEAIRFAPESSATLLTCIYVKPV